MPDFYQSQEILVTPSNCKSKFIDIDDMMAAADHICMYPLSTNVYRTCQIIQPLLSIKAETYRQVNDKMYRSTAWDKLAKYRRTACSLGPTDQYIHCQLSAELFGRTYRATHKRPILIGLVGLSAELRRHLATIAGIPDE